MSPWIYLLLIVYGLFLSFIFAFSLVQLSLSLSYLKKHKTKALKSAPKMDESQLPAVCVQLPIYNEKYVIKRLLDAVMALDYPKLKLRIQILDDSTDETSDIVRNLIDINKNSGVVLEHIQRAERVGYKAGALEYGLKLVQEEFVAIFDADFVPDSSFLKGCVQELKDSKIACVQTRWAHLNEEENVLTKSQAMALNSHFRIEQVGRHSQGHFINFNGTAGMWRKEVILDSGGWQSDTLTEDLDLSYRAQMRGWKMAYLEELTSPAELPMVLSALRTQQHRWNKGAAECARKHLVPLFRDPTIPWQTKIQALFHLLNSGVFISVLVLTVLSVPLLMVKTSVPSLSPYMNFAAFFSISFGILALFFWLPFSKDWDLNELRQKDSWWKKRFEFTRRYLAFVAVSMSFSHFNSIAVISGYLGVKSPFVRTPKFNQTASMPKENSYNRRQLPGIFYLDLLLFGYFFFASVYGMLHLEFGLLPMHLLLLLGLGTLLSFAWRERA